MRRVLWLLIIAVLCCALATAQSKGKPMQATGTFEVNVAPQEATDFEKANGLNRYTMQKTWHGGFEGTSRGEMLGGDASTGAMAYVAVERMTGTLAGKTGTFILLHNANMMKGDLKSAVMHITIVPNSGTGELTGITGTLTINILDGKHTWVLEYMLP